jgi:hypothetical protein
MKILFYVVRMRKLGDSHYSTLHFVTGYVDGVYELPFILDWTEQTQSTKNLEMGKWKSIQ